MAGRAENFFQKQGTPRCFRTGCALFCFEKPALPRGTKPGGKRFLPAAGFQKGKPWKNHPAKENVPAALPENVLKPPGLADAPSGDAEKNRFCLKNADARETVLQKRGNFLKGLPEESGKSSRFRLKNAAAQKQLCKTGEFLRTFRRKP